MARGYGVVVEVFSGVDVEVDVLVEVLPDPWGTLPSGASVTLGWTVTVGAGAVTVVVLFCVVFCWTVLVTCGVVAVAPSSPLEMIAAARPPSARTIINPMAMSQPLPPWSCCSS
jgi:hypothetical protein